MNPPGEPNGRHRRLGSGVDEPDLLDARHHGNDQFRQFGLLLGRSAESESAARLRPDRLDNASVAVSEQHWPPGRDIVDVGVAVDVLQVDAVAGLEEDRMTAYALECAHGRIDAARYRTRCAGEQSLGFAAIHGRADPALTVGKSTRTASQLRER